LKQDFSFLHSITSLYLFYFYNFRSVCQNKFFNQNSYFIFLLMFILLFVFFIILHLILNIFTNQFFFLLFISFLVNVYFYKHSYSKLFHVPNAEFSGEERRRAKASRRSESAATYVWHVVEWDNFPTALNHFFILQILIKICNHIKNKALIWQNFNQNYQKTNDKKCRLKLNSSLPAYLLPIFPFFYFSIFQFSNFLILLKYLFYKIYKTTIFRSTFHWSKISYFFILSLDYVYFIFTTSDLFVKINFSTKIVILYFY